MYPMSKVDFPSDIIEGISRYSWLMFYGWIQFVRQRRCQYEWE